MALVLFKLTGAVSTLALVADVGFVQFVASGACDAGSGDAVRDVDLFDLVPAPWDGVIRTTALAFAGLNAIAAVLELACPRTFTRWVSVGRPAGTLVASSTSAI